METNTDFSTNDLPYPFTVSDVQFAVQQLEDNSAGNSWSFLRNGSPEGLGSAAEFYYTTDSAKLLNPDCPPLQLKLLYKALPLPAKQVALLLVDPEVRVKWDTGAPIVRPDAGATRRPVRFIWSVKSPWPLYTRLIVQDAAGFACDNDTFVSFYKGYNDDDFDRSSPRFPSRYVRSRSGLTLTVARPNADRPTTHCDICTIGNNSLGGVLNWLPYSVSAELTAKTYEKVYCEMLAKGSKLDLEIKMNEFQPWKVIV